MLSKIMDSCYSSYHTLNYASKLDDGKKIDNGKKLDGSIFLVFIIVMCALVFLLTMCTSSTNDSHDPSHAKYQKPSDKTQSIQNTHNSLKNKSAVTAPAQQPQELSEQQRKEFIEQAEALYNASLIKLTESHLYANSTLDNELPAPDYFATLKIYNQGMLEGTFKKMSGRHYFYLTMIDKNNNEYTFLCADKGLNVPLLLKLEEDPTMVGEKIQVHWQDAVIKLWQPPGGYKRIHHLLTIELLDS